MLKREVDVDSVEMANVRAIREQFVRAILHLARKRREVNVHDSIFLRISIIVTLACCHYVRRE